MKITLNLYHSSCHPKREKATFTQFLLLLAICIFASAISYYVVNKQVKTLNDSLLAKKEQINEQQLVLSDLVVQLQKNRAPDEKLRKHSALQNEIKAKQRLLASLAGIDVKESLSFSRLMRGLAYADMPDVTINRFSMTEGVLNIKGTAAHSDSVPLWLSKMQDTNELSEIAFTTLSISEQKSFFTFQLINSDLKGKK